MVLEVEAAGITTTVDLPKRLSEANAGSGSIASREEATEPTGEPAQPPLPPRSMAVVRRKMSSSQQGVRQGSHSLGDIHAEGKTSTDKSQQDNEHTG